MTNLAVEIKAENVYDPFFEYLDDCINQIENDPTMVSLYDIISELFEKRAEIMGLLAKSLLESKFADLLNQEHQQLARDLEKIKNAGLIPDNRVHFCVVADGASWIWNRIQELFPDAKLVLDYYHCSENLHALSKAQFGKEFQQGRHWVEPILAKLFQNHVEEALNDIENLEVNTDEAQKEKEKTFRYLEKRRDKINYGATRRGGYNIGSGAIESSNKFISNVRLKKSGAWWYPSCANNILKLRCAIYNGTFDGVVDRYKKKFEKEKAKANPTPKIQLVVDNC